MSLTWLFLLLLMPTVITVLMPTVKMPREKRITKFQYKEVCCSMFVRSDKWNNHCKEKHGFKCKRYYESARSRWPG